MGKKTKLVHFSIVDGTAEEIAALGTSLGKIKDTLPIDIEFIVTNDNIRLHDVKFLIDELYKLYKMQNKD